MPDLQNNKRSFLAAAMADLKASFLSYDRFSFFRNLSSTGIALRMLRMKQRQLCKEVIQDQPAVDGMVNPDRSVQFRMNIGHVFRHQRRLDPVKLKSVLI